MVKKNKKRIVFILITISAILIICLLIISYYLFFYNTKNKGGGKKLTNPALGLTFEEAVEKFDESFVLYLLASIEAYKLHNTPFSSETPKIEFYISDDVYNAEIIKGSINVKKGEIDDEDITITTTKEEGVKMLLDENYIDDSFKEGKSSAELIAGKLELAAKGYLEIYDNFTG